MTDVQPRRTIKDVAAAAGVSIKTVSRVLNREPNVRQDTIDRVNAAAEALGFTVNLSARRLASGRSHSLGMLVVTRSHWHRTADLVSGALTQGQTRGYGLVPYVLQSYEGRERDVVLSLVSQKLVDGLLLTTPWSEVDGLGQDLADRGMPFVSIAGPASPGRLSVRADEEAGAYAVTRHLLDGGHRRIAVIGGQRALFGTRERLTGYERAMRETGHDPAAQRHVFGDYLFPTGYRAARSLLSDPTPPTAILAFTDVLAAGALRAAHEARVAVPDQLSIVGMGDFALAQFVWPALTTVAVPSPEMAAKAVDLLIECVEGRRPPEPTVVFPTPLIVRDSSGPAPG